MKRSLLFLAVFALIGLTIQVIRVWPDGKLHITYCDVGQGDSAYIRFPNGADMLVDGGPINGHLTDCLSAAMPFFDRQIDIVLLTHPQADHMAGLINVLDRYSVTYFVTPPVGNTSQGFRDLVNKLGQKHIPVKNLYAGSFMHFGESTISILWPEKEWTLQQVQSSKCKVQSYFCLVNADNSDQLIAQTTNVLGAQASEDLNHYSMIFELSYGTFDALFTGDADIPPQRTMLADGIVVHPAHDSTFEVLKVPHHGSRTGLFEDFLQTVHPKLAVISVGKHNTYGHPAPETVKRLTDAGSKVLRTDQEGSIEVISDGKDWIVKEKGREFRL